MKFLEVIPNSSSRTSASSATFMLTLSSIVAVHGLNGDSTKTWTTNKTKKFWLGDADMLPTNLKNARILTFGYDAAVTALFGKASSDRILQHAHTLIAELVADRQVRLFSWLTPLNMILIFTISWRGQSHDP